MKSREMNTRKKNVTQPQKKDTSAMVREFSIPYPLLILSFVVIILYGSSVSFDFTELDDSIFIKEQQAYNKDLANLYTSFTRGVFNPTEDVYYRPLLLDSFILNYQIGGTSIKAYHVVNILLHLLAVSLLFLLLLKLHFRQWQAFLLALLFAVHPALSQAVAWIPGRNDTLLAVFVFSFFNFAIRYAANSKPASLIFQFIALLLALFTKETAVFAAPVAFILLVLVLDKPWSSKKNLYLYASWFLAFMVWFYTRSQATLKNDQLQFSEVLTAMPARLPVLLQYFGKIILPVNLSVFPIVADTSNVYGIVALLLVMAMLLLSSNRNNKIILAGLSIYVLFLIPALLVPGSLNDQDFEHRLYLPTLGILLLIPQTILFNNKWRERQVFLAGVAVCLVLAIINYNHQQKFRDAITFWKEATHSSPHSAYANMMLGARLKDSDPEKADSLIKAAFALNPEEKYVNYYMGKMMVDLDSFDTAEKYFLAEIKRSNYYECYFHMARIAFAKNDFDQAITYLTTYLQSSPADPQGNNNLLLLYLQTNQLPQAKLQVKRMQQLGLPIPAEAQQLLQ